MLGREPPGYAGRRIPTWVPCYLPTPGICTPSHHPGYTSSSARPSRLHCGPRPGSREAALRRKVAERYISGLLIYRRGLPTTRFTVGRWLINEAKSSAQWAHSGRMVHNERRVLHRPSPVSLLVDVECVTPFCPFWSLPGAIPYGSEGPAHP